MSAWPVIYDACKRSGEILTILHPDIVYSDGILARITGAFEDPRIAVAVKRMCRVVSETLGPVLDDMKSADGVLSVSGPELARLSLVHMHHWDAATHQHSRVFRPTWESFFLGRQRFAHGCTSLEVSAIDPQRADATSHFTLYASTRPEITLINDVSDGLSASLTPFSKSLEFLSPASWEPSFEITKGATQELLRPLSDPALEQNPFLFASRQDATAADAGQVHRRFSRPVRSYSRLIELRDLIARHDSMDATVLQLCVVAFPALKRMPIERPALIYLPAFSLSQVVLRSLAGKPPRAMREELLRHVSRWFGFIDGITTSESGRLLNGTAFNSERAA